MTDLDRLADLAGIEAGWWDFFGTWRVVADDTKRAFLAAMGIAGQDDAAVAHSIVELEERPWRRWLEPVVVLKEDGQPLVPVTFPAKCDLEEISWSFDEEIGVTHRGAFRPGDLPLLGERGLDDGPRMRRLFTLPDLPPLGYHRLRLHHGQAAAEATVIVAPARGHAPPEIAEGQRLWGVAAQVYALRSARDWGMGDYGDLQSLAAEVAGLGAAAVGVNPLHALFPNRPERFSPYSPSSRLFANVLYIDVDAMPDLADSPQAQAMLAGPDFVARLSELRGREKVDYVGVARQKMMALRAIYADFRRHHLGSDGVGGESDRGQAFRDFQRQSGHAAELFATFEALQAHFLRQDTGLGYWRHWPEEFRHPGAPAVAEFARAERAEVEFFWYLQWQAEVQLAAVATTCREARMPIGLYRDLGVGIADDGGEAWARQDLLSLGVTVGAPPDPLNHRGQDWGLAPFNPMALREAAYQPFIDVLRANMRHAGALRLDHAMQLQRLYWVPRGATPEKGAYVRFPVEDLFAIVALESRRNCCLVVGEDLGTVPEGFRERMFASGIFGYRLLVFERHDDGSFKAPEEYIERALVSFGTHDLPSLVGYWRGADLQSRAQHGLYPEAEMVESERRARQEGRRGLVAALRAKSLLPDGFPDGTLTEEQFAQLFEAIHVYLDLTPCDVMMVQVEDALLLDVQLNLPGTTDQHPNWRFRLPVEVSALAGCEPLRQLAKRLLPHRCSRRQRDVVRLDDSGG